MDYTWLDFFFFFASSFSSATESFHAHSSSLHRVSSLYNAPHTFQCAPPSFGFSYGKREDGKHAEEQLTVNYRNAAWEDFVATHNLRVVPLQMKEEKSD